MTQNQLRYQELQEAIRSHKELEKHYGAQDAIALATQREQEVHNRKLEEIQYQGNIIQGVVNVGTSILRGATNIIGAAVKGA